MAPDATRSLNCEDSPGSSVNRPKVFFQVGAAWSFSEQAVTIVASISTVISVPSAPGAASPAAPAEPRRKPEANRWCHGGGWFHVRAVSELRGRLPG